MSECDCGACEEHADLDAALAENAALRSELLTLRLHRMDDRYCVKCRPIVAAEVSRIVALHLSLKHEAIDALRAELDAALADVARWRAAAEARP